MPYARCRTWPHYGIVNPDCCAFVVRVSAPAPDLGDANGDKQHGHIGGDVDMPLSHASPGTPPGFAQVWSLRRGDALHVSPARSRCCGQLRHAQAHQRADPLRIRTPGVVLRRGATNEAPFFRCPRDGLLGQVLDILRCRNGESSRVGLNQTALLLNDGCRLVFRVSLVSMIVRRNP